MKNYIFHDVRQLLGEEAARELIEQAHKDAKWIRSVFNRRSHAIDPRVRSENTRKAHERKRDRALRSKPLQAV